MVTGAPLVDARHLAQRYERMRQETESQVILNAAPLLFLCALFFYVNLKHVFIEPTLDY